MVIKLFTSKEEAGLEVPIGTTRKLIIQEKPYLLIHTPSGFAVSEYLCPHQNEPLDKGLLNSFDELICPLHEYRFNLTTGAESSQRCKDLTLYQVAVKSDGLYIEV